ncbi:MAG: CD225/dispanin family protein [Flavobacteriales bacterium]|nr:CD225/dispanin family protein [Flavobacteriales bacterium]
MQGNHAAAQKAADDAKKYSIWGAVISAVLWILYLIFVVVLGMGGAFAGY